MLNQYTHFDICQNENCERKWCVDRRNAKCIKEDGCEIEAKSKTNRCKWCHTKFFCSGYGECPLHGDHGP
jgi:hypothetical protein